MSETLARNLSVIDAERERLRQTVIDPVLLQRIESAQRILRERGAEEQELEARVTRQKAIVASAKAAVEVSEQKQGSIFRGDKVARTEVAHRLPAERQFLEESERELERLERQLADVRDEMQPARDELQQCELLKLIP